MTHASELNVIDVLKNLVLACEANGLRDLPFVQDARRVIDAPPSHVQLIKELREAAEDEDNAAGPPSYYHGDMLRYAANALESVTSSAPVRPVGWETAAEYEMERKTFSACNRTDVPKDVQELVAHLWKQYCLAAAPNDPKTLTKRFEDFWQEEYGVLPPSHWVEMAFRAKIDSKAP
jgi:hypothetical protein